MDDLFGTMPMWMLGRGNPPLIGSWDHFSDDGLRRFRLEYWWDYSLPPLICCGQNPSKATRKRGDHTITVSARRAHQLGFGGLSMVNLFCEVHTKPEALWAMGEALDEWEGAALDAIANALREHGGGVVLFAPGGDPQPRHRRRAVRVERLIRGVDRTLMCLGVTAGGLPRHPSRLGYDAKMIPWHGTYAAAMREAAAELGR